jgi:polar amino acid transport system ATP-binding protein
LEDVAKPHALGVPEGHFISVRGVFKSYGDLEVLKGVSLNVDRGEIVCLIGPSGSGKTTMLRCINGLEAADSGSIVVNGREVVGTGVKTLSAIRRHIGMVFQDFNLFPHRSVLENVMEGPAVVLKLPRQVAEERARKLLAQVGLSEKAASRPGRLSGGQKQRVAIARALAMEPDLMLFDEPTSALDPELVNEVLAVIGGLAATGITMIIVTHEIHFAERIADRVLMFDAGVIIEEGAPAELLHDAREARTRLFLAQLEH